MAGLWDAIKNEASAPRSIVNDDIQTAIDPVRGAPVKTHRDEGLKFKPVSFDETVKQGEQRFVVISDPAGCRRQVNEKPYSAFENPNLDLVSEDVIRYLPTPSDVIEEKPKRKQDGRSSFARAFSKASAMIDAAELAAEAARKARGGRPRKHQTNAERQQAYRDRCKAK